MNRDKNIRALNAYMRRRQLPEDVGGCLNGVLVFVAIIAVSGIVYAPEFTLPLIAIAIGAYCLWYFFWRNRPLTALGVTGEIFEDELYDELLEDYAWTVPLFNQKLLVGEKWLFPESAEHPVLMSGIESMRLHTVEDPLLPDGSRGSFWHKLQKRTQISGIRDVEIACISWYHYEGVGKPVL